MLIEYQEDFLISESFSEDEKEEDEIENENLGLIDENKDKIVKLTKEEIDSDYNNLDLTQFNK